ncbi:hypothetical protein MTR67_035463 [Solanum verrucosum]|uniref:Tf2-1-like SH3-like domain-containing protein n=1 Tax=Solanum verrucosum TaxID=315347 RepID=A0AAF0ZLH9_SOLVR|nr:hypothetical protein MTR67_035463 [Solanum verrucosum]
MVVDALSRLWMGSVARVEDDMKELVRDVHILAQLGVCYHSSIGMAPFEALYARRCRSRKGWFELGEVSLIGPELVQEAMEKGVKRFGNKGKLSLRYVGPYQILRRIRKVTYELEFHNELASVHSIFHVSFLKKCVVDMTSIVPLEGLGVRENISYEEVSVEILDRKVRKLRNKEVSSVKVLWRNQLFEGATWEVEADMMSRYPRLFPSAPILA